MKPETKSLRTAIGLIFFAGALLFAAHKATAAQKAFFIFQSPATEIVPADLATNVTITLTYSNASGTINNAVFTNGVSVVPSGQGVTAGLNSTTPAVSDNGGTATLPLTVSATATAPSNTTYQIIVSATNNAFTANVPSGAASVTNTFIVGAPANSNAFSMALSPTTASVPAGVATNFNSTITFVDYSATISGLITNGVTVSGPDTANVTAALNNDYAALTINFGQTNLTLTVNVNSNALAGAYAVSVMGTNNAFTANPTPGNAAVYFSLTLTSPASITPLSIQNCTLTGTTLEMAGANGLPGRRYTILSATNLAVPLQQWAPVLTNVFDGNGNFDASFTLANASGPNAAQQFFIVSFNPQDTNSLPTVAIPAFSPIAGSYYAETPVTISTTTGGATVRYTTDGSTPSEINGVIYTGPVTMAQAVDTNLTGFLTNCSGITMLKAIAYQNGMADSPVWTGNFEILVPMKYPPSSSPVEGIAHVGYHVTGANWTNTLDFWTNYFGFGAVVVSSNFALIKINDQQFVELYQGALDSSQFQLADWGFQVTNAEAYREQLAAAGVSVPPAVSTNALGNLSFFTTDPDGHTNEWIQYLTNSITGLSQGQDMPGTQLFGYINGIGDCTTNESAADNYYIGQCGFVTNQTHDVYIPNVNGYVELLTANPGQVTAQLAGKHEKIQLLNFHGLVLSQSVNVLTNRAPSIAITLSVEGTPGTKQQDAADVYDADGSRVRCVDE